jgi:hypothetical protein
MNISLLWYVFQWSSFLARLTTSVSFLTLPPLHTYNIRKGDMKSFIKWFLISGETIYLERTLHMGSYPVLSISTKRSTTKGRRTSPPCFATWALDGGQLLGLCVLHFGWTTVL